jgi:hypothetical protein
MGEPTGWTPAEFNAVPIPQLEALFGEHEAQPRYWSAAEQLAYWNRKRAEQGLPPIPPRKRG